jgi:serine/threonine-protein kinase
MGEIFGTPQYMAPERATSIDAGPPADLYALGVIMFEMMTQRLPFDAPDPASWILKHSREPPPRLKQFQQDAPDALDQLIWSMMAKEPGDRPVDAHRVLAEIGEIAAAAKVALPPEPEVAPPPEAFSAPPSVGRDPWLSRAAIFERMLGRGFPSGQPADLARMLEALKAHVRELGELRARALDEQQRLEVVEREGRDGRMQIGRAMDELTADASLTREEARAHRARV